MRRLFILALSLAPVGAAVSAQTWPDRPLRLIIPFAPGGVTDSVGRLSAEALGARLGQSVVVENRTCAGGAIAVVAVVRSQPDGYTLLTASASQRVMLPALTRVPHDAARDLAPISIIGANPGRVGYSSGGNGSSNHLAMALLLHRAGVAAYFGDPSDIMPHQGGAAIRVLAVAGAAPMAALPGVLTVAAQGFPGFRAETWNGIAAPAGTPEAAITRMAETLGAACGEAPFRAAMERDGPQWAELVRVAGLKLE